MTVPAMKGELLSGASFLLPRLRQEGCRTDRRKPVASAPTGAAASDGGRIGKRATEALRDPVTDGNGLATTSAESSRCPALAMG